MNQGDAILAMMLKDKRRQNFLASLLMLLIAVAATGAHLLLKIFDGTDLALLYAVILFFSFVFWGDWLVMRYRLRKGVYGDVRHEVEEVAEFIKRHGGRPRLLALLSTRSRH